MPERIATLTEGKLSPDELAEAMARQRRFQSNSDRFHRQAIEIGEKYRGKHVVVAGGETFVGDEFGETRQRAIAAHPEEHDSLFFRYISTDRGPRLYAHLRRLGT